VQRFRGGLVSKNHRLAYHSTPGLRMIKKKKKKVAWVWSEMPRKRKAEESSEMSIGPSSDNV